MAEVAPTVAVISGDGSVVSITWETITTTDTSGTMVGTAGKLPMARLADKTVQISGTFGTGATLVLEGSNDGTNWFTLTDPQGNAISATTAGGNIMEAVTENPLYYRPSLSGGSGTTDLDVIMIAALSNDLRT